MKLPGICGASGAGKTTLIEGLIAALRARSQRAAALSDHLLREADRFEYHSRRHG